MKGLEELLVMAFDLQATEDDLQPCCNKPVHKAHYLSLAMVEAGRTWHEANHGPLRYGTGDGPVNMPPPIELCTAFPCRVTREFGDLNHEH